MIKNSCYYCVYKNYCWIGRTDRENQKNITCHGFTKKDIKNKRGVENEKRYN